jgi:predicted dehydrogenase
MITRRTFLKSTGLAAAGSALSARSWGQVTGANGDLRIAVAGLHSRGKSLIEGFRVLPGVRVVALCDVDSAILARTAAAYSIPATFADLRDILGRPDIDAVGLATPNHWHALQTVWACQAGKDVYVEKPVSHDVWEGQQMIAALRKYDRIGEAGSQARSSPAIMEAVAWVRAGNFGRITAARGLCYKRRPSIGLTTGPQPVPATVNYDLWCGPAPLTPPRRKQFHYDWHWFWSTGNGDIGNQGLHQMDVARWFLGEEGVAPRALAVGGRLGYLDDGQTPNTLAVVHDYPSAPLIFEVRGLPAHPGTQEVDTYRGLNVGVVIHCEGGDVLVPASYTSAQAVGKDGKVVREFKGGASHFANFAAVLRSRRAADLHVSVAQSHISSCLAHFSNISYRLGAATAPGELAEKIQGRPALSEAAGRMLEHLAVNQVDFGQTPLELGYPLEIDPAGQRCVGHDEANAFLRREYRAPYVVPAAV